MIILKRIIVKKCNIFINYPAINRAILLTKYLNATSPDSTTTSQYLFVGIRPGTTLVKFFAACSPSGRE